MKRFYALLLICSLILTHFSGCSKNKDQQNDVKQVAFITNNTSDFWQFARRGCEKAENQLQEISVNFRLTSDATSAEQRRIIDDLLAKGVQAIAISPIDPANQKPFIDQLSQQIPVITCDSDIPNSQRLCYLGTDNIAAGRQAGELVKEVLPKGGKIMLFVGKKDSQNAKERIEGIRQAIEDTDIEIIDIRTDNTDQVRAKSNVSDALVKYPDLACCVGLWNYNGPAILNAVTDAGKLGQVEIVCFDEDQETLIGVRDGHIHGTVVQQPFEFGYQSINILADILKGDKSAIPSDRKIIIPTLVIKQEKSADFLNRIDQLLKK